MFKFRLSFETVGGKPQVQRYERLRRAESSRESGRASSISAGCSTRFACTRKANCPADYQPNLGSGFDGWCVDLLRVDYDELVERVKAGGTDEEILDWCFAKGRQPPDDEIHIWNEFMRKRGWNDDISETLTRRKKEAGMAGRSEIRTMFEFIDADEGRPISNGP